MNKKSFVLMFLGLMLSIQSLSAQVLVHLESQNWKISFQNSRENARPEFDDSNWKTVSLPGNLIYEKAWRKKKKTIWLRYHLSENLHNTNENLALVMGSVFDHDETYFNGVMIGRSPGQKKITSNYGRPRIYTIPSRLIRLDQNVIAIKLKGSFKSKIGIVDQPFFIAPVGIAHTAIWKKEVYHLIFVALYVVTGAFFLLLYFKLSQLKVYKWFGIFALVFGLYQFLTNELRFQIMDTFLLYKIVEHICYLSIPVIYFHFFIYFFNIKSFSFTKIAPRRVALYYSFFNASCAILFMVVFDPIFWDQAITWWAINIIPLSILLFYYMLKKALFEINRDAIFLSLGSIALLYFSVDFYSVQRGFWAGQTHFNEGLFVFFLSVTFSLVFRLIEIQMEVNERTTRLGTVENMQERVFNYLNLFLQKPVEDIVTFSHSIKELPSAASLQINIAQLGTEVQAMEYTLDDILELSRLEVINEPEFLEPVNFYDFINAVIPTGKITHYIKVNREIMLNTSLELVNSFVVRVIDFPAFNEFQHIDLIITSDLNGNIHFRFMLFHSNIRKTRQLREVLTEMNPEKGELWLKWAIIREIIRILRGDLEIKIINKKFLSIDIYLKAELSSQDSNSAHSDYIEIIKKANEDNLSESIATPIEKSVGARPKFHSQMTLTDFLRYIKSVFKK